MAAITLTFRLFTTVTLTLLFTACLPSNTNLTSDWKNPNASGQPLTKVVVFVIAKDEALRRYAEDQMVAKMSKSVTSVAGYTMFDKPEKNVAKVRETLIKNGFDGALVTRLVSIKESEEYVPPQTVVQQVRPDYGNFGYYHSFNGYYSSAYNSTFVTMTPGYTVHNTNVIVETMLYRLPDGALLWTGTTDTLNPDKKSELADGIINIVESKINQDGLLGGK